MPRRCKVCIFIAGETKIQNHTLGVSELHLGHRISCLHLQTEHNVAKDVPFLSS